MKYPKLRNGPSPVGEAMVRALQQTDAPYLTSQTADGIIARKSGYFQEVEGGELLEFSSVGTLMKNGQQRGVTKVSSDVRKTFKGYFNKRADYIGPYKALQRDLIGIATDVLEVNPVIGDKVIYYVSNEVGEVTPFFKTIRNPITLTGNILSTTLYYLDGVLVSTYIPNRLPIFPIRKNLDGSTALLVSVSLLSGETNGAGFPVCRPAYLITNSKTWGGVTFFLPSLGFNNRHHLPPKVVTAGGGVAYIVDIMVRDYFDNEIGSDSSTRILVHRTINYGVSWTTTDATNIIWNGARAAASESATSVADLTAKLLPIGNGEALLNIIVTGDNPNSGLPNDVGNPQPNTASLSRIILLRPAGSPSVIWEGIEDNFISDPLVTGGSWMYFRAWAYLGNNRIIALAGGNAAFNQAAPTNLYISDNRGATWTQLLGDGLPPVKESQYFGDFTVIEPWEGVEGPQGEVILTAYDQSKNGYYVYASRDGGESWVQQGAIAKTEEFYRMDPAVTQADSGQIGSSFRKVEYYGSYIDKAEYNPAIPGFLD